MGRYSAPCRENMSVLTTSHVGPVILFSAVLLYVQYIYSKYWKLLQGPCDICRFLFDVSLFTVWVTSEDFAEKFKKVNCV